MTSERSNEFGFAAVHDAPVPYMRRTRDYYLALGYGPPYEWARYAQVPFHPLQKPLVQCRIALITTASPYHPDKGVTKARARHTTLPQSSTASIPVTKRPRPADLACRH